MVTSTFALQECRLIDFEHSIRRLDMFPVRSANWVLPQLLNASVKLAEKVQVPPTSPYRV